MTDFAKAGRFLALTSMIAAGLSLSGHYAVAKSHHPLHVASATGSYHGRAGHEGVRGYAESRHGRLQFAGMRFEHGGSRRFAWRGGLPVLQCVTFARADTGIQLSGNASNWWDNAAGIYARGSSPEPGSVLAFRASGRMRLGHVAVVSNIINSRVVEIDQAHWAGRGITRNIPVIDVSPNNDWTSVRVGLGQSGDFGSIYPTHGFIYPRAEASAGGLEVAEVPGRARGVDLSNSSFNGFTFDAPDRSLR